MPIARYCSHSVIVPHMQAEGWEVKEDEKQVLSIARTYKTKNFVKVHLQNGRANMLTSLRTIDAFLMF